jgi:diadenosine tetraphosphate (Ap4A) HIT family hydrolase
MFSLDPKLKSDTHFVADLKISRLLLMNDVNYPWLILVPQKENAVELTDLTFDEQTEVLHEINLVAKILQQHFSCDKINIAALGNITRQLHIHVIARFKNDVAFPKPVWGFAQAKPYGEEAAWELIEKIKSSLNGK